MKSKNLRFGLRTFLIVATLAAAIMGYFGNRMYRDFLQTKAVEAITKAGGKMIRNEDKKPTRVLFLGAAFGDEQLDEMTRHLRNLPELKELDFVRTSITDSGIEFLTRVNQIDELYLFESKLTEKGLADLKNRMPSVAIKLEEPEPISSGMASMNVYSHAMVALDWTPDGSFLATGSGDGQIRMWDFDNNEPAFQWKAHTDWAFAIAFSPDGKIIATGGGDNAVRLWDANTREFMAELSGHSDDVHSVGFTPDGKTLISSGDDMTIRFWDLETETTVRVLKGHTAQIPSIAIGPQGKLLASASRDDTVRLWNIQSGELLAVFPTEQNDVNTVAFDTAGEQLASGDQGGIIKIWDLSTRELKTTLTGHNGKVYRIAFDRSTQTLASCGDDGIRIWHLDNGTSKSVGRKQEYVSNLAFHPSRDLLASTSAAGEVHLLSGLTGETLKVLRTMYGERGFDLDLE